MGEATFRVPAPAVYDRIRLRDGEVAWLRPDPTHQYSLDGECWYLTADGSPYVQRGVGSVRLEAPRGGGWLYTTQPMLVRLAARGASFVPYAPNELVGIANPVSIGNLPSAWAAGMPVVETIYDSGVKFIVPGSESVSSGQLSLTAYERVFASFVSGSGGDAETKLEAFAYAYGDAGGLAVAKLGVVSWVGAGAKQSLLVLVAGGAGVEGGYHNQAALPASARFNINGLTGSSATKVDARIKVTGVRRG